MKSVMLTVNFIRSECCMPNSNAVRKPLQPPYKGPYKILRRNDKFYILDVNGKEDTVSVDRLKVAYFESDTRTTVEQPPASPITSTTTEPTPITEPAPTSTPTASSPPVRKTRSGRHVHWPKKFRKYST